MSLMLHQFTSLYSLSIEGRGGNFCSSHAVSSVLLLLDQSLQVQDLGEQLHGIRTLEMPRGMSPSADTDTGYLAQQSLLPVRREDDGDAS